ncbi:hypothetical protein [Thioalkalivibrio sp. ALJT]|uniref:hypothetical protein n=1 Tax=Thioalkalivibrio sp. ALJT TaxID=1158146 RepID=UPI000368F3AC|nr:hypothetical protein [Thioalkalivibrio sp. ALJT]
MLQSLPDLPIQPAGPGSFPHRTAPALQNWCAELPGSEPETGIRLLGEALEALNAIALQPGLRSELLDILKQSLLPLLPAEEHLLRQRPLPLGARSRERAERFDHVLRQLTRAELLVVRERLDTEGSQHGKALTRPLQSAVALLGAQSLHYWRLYRHLPAGQWQQTYDLLRLARSQGISDQPAATQQRFGPLQIDRIEHMAARLIVLGSIDTNALKIGEIDLLTRWINNLAVECRAAPDASTHPDLPVLRCELDRDRAPELVLRGVPHGESPCFVELAPVLDALREHPDFQERGSRRGPSQLAERLLRLWSHLPTRRHSRESGVNQQRVCVLGLKHIHDFLQSELEANRRASETAAESKPEDTGPRRLHEHDRGISVFEMSTAARHGSDLALVEDPSRRQDHHDLQPLAEETPDTRAMAWEDISHTLQNVSHGEPHAPITKRHPPEHWAVDNIGAGGVGLRLDNPQQTLLIGDLVGLRAVDGHRWTIGVLRWIRYEDPAAEAATGIGVEFLADRCLPMQIQYFRNGLATGTPQPGLFAPQRTDTEGAALFLPAQTFDHEKLVACWLNGRARVLELDNQRTGTTLFTEVGCRLTTREVSPPQADTDTPDDGLSFTGPDGSSP